MKQERYRIIGCIEQNSSSALYEVYDNVLERNSVLKEIPVKLKKIVTATQQEELKLAFANKAKALTELKHDSLLHVYDYFSGIDRNYLVMESIDGDCLDALLKENKGFFALSDIINWAEQLLDALGYLHKRTPSVIHRAVNPQNIKLTSDGKIKLLTLGIAKKGEPIESSKVKNQAFDVKTLNYLSLEQIFKGLDSASQKVITNSYDEKSEMILKQPADARSDIYGLGATLYHLLTGRAPVDALERSIDILEDKPDPLLAARELNPNVPVEISDILMKAMEIRRENRFESAIIMRQILRTAFVRLLEREDTTQKTQEEEIILEFPVAKTVSTESALQIAERERLKIEAEQKRETELIKQQLRESENQRLQAEKRAEEAERRLLEKQAKIASENKAQEDKVSVSMLNSAENSDVEKFQVNDFTDFGKQKSEGGNPANEYKDLFVQPPKNNRIWKQMSLAALIILMLGGVVFGVFNFQVLENMPNQMTQNQITTLVDKVVTEPIVEAASIPTVEPTIEPTPETEIEPAAPEMKAITERAETPVYPKTPVTKTVYKTKTFVPAPVPPRIQKPVAAQPKPQPKKEKTLTVDDIISGN